MNAQFSIRVDPERDLVRIRMSGFFTHQDIADFAEAALSRSLAPQQRGQTPGRPGLASGRHRRYPACIHRRGLHVSRAL